MIIIKIFTFGFICMIILSTLYFYFYKSKGIVRIKQLESIKLNYSQTIKNEKRLIIGGSDVLYSFNTDKMNESEEIKTVNFGTNVGLGLGYLLDFTKKELKPGDHVIACLAYSLYFNPPYHIFAFEYFRMYNKKKLTLFTLKQGITYFIGNIKYNYRYKQKKFQIGKSGCYLNVVNQEWDKRKEKPLNFPKEFKMTESLKALEEFKKYCQEIDVKLTLSYSQTLFFNDYSESDYLVHLHEYLKKNYQVLGNPKDYFVSLDEIYNSVYHVNKKGQDFRTAQLLHQLNEGMNNVSKT